MCSQATRWEPRAMFQSSVDEIMNSSKWQWGQDREVIKRTGRNLFEVELIRPVGLLARGGKEKGGI